MPKYSFAVCIEISAYTEVEAESLEAAIAEAHSRGLMSLPAMAKGDSTCEWTTELDNDMSEAILVEAWEDDTYREAEKDPELRDMWEEC